MSVVRACYVCEGEMTWGEARQYREADGRILVFEGVPALVCQLCGQAVFMSAVLDEIDRIARDQPSPDRAVEASVYDLWRTRRRG